MALKLIFNPITSNFDWIDQFTGSTSDGYQVYKVTITATELTNKQVTLPFSPLVASETRATVISGIEQQYSTDFTVSGTTFSWNGLGLEPLLELNDELIIIYKT